MTQKPDNNPLTDTNEELPGNSALYLEYLYETWQNAPDQVDAKWHQLFSQMQDSGNQSAVQHSVVRERFRQTALDNHYRGTTSSPGASEAGESSKQIKVLQLINSYRFLGHQKANTNPLDEAGIAVEPKPEVPELQLAYHDLSEQDLNSTFKTGSLVSEDELTLAQIVDKLEKSYCDVIGAQYMYISSTEEKRWLQERLETRKTEGGYTANERKELLKKLVAAETLERYLHTKYVGQKRFSLEGGDSLIPLLDTLIQRAGSAGAREIVLGMAHRGRLNVLINIMGKASGALFREFAGDVDNGGRSGDVKYHLGYSSDMATPGGPVHLALAFNPSHLEIVGPVVEGSVRARQDRRHGNPGDEVIPVVIHGDAALAGQGVNMETLNMSETRGFRTHGTIHIVINNQIGFTTSTTMDSRSTEYCTDLAKMVGAPVFHVNGDHPEAVLDIARIAVDYRKTFNKDVFIDLVCYRRHGHNEADEPSATQPVMYQKIKALATAQARYAKRLINEGVLDNDEFQQYIKDYRAALDEGQAPVKNLLDHSSIEIEFPVNWGHFKNTGWREPADTTISEDRFSALGHSLTVTPDDFAANKRVAAILNKRKQMAENKTPADWGFAENLAYAALLQEGFPVRLSGEDCGRGTFFHRHAVLHDQNDGHDYIPLQNLTDDQSRFTVIDSLLSEEAVLAFEYGYSTTEANILTIWEAQFGDFANGAQMVIDQFISSAEQKWDRLSGLVMLLPHGYEGMGPEHSSARLERYLQLCAQENMQVCIPTTPSQVFHMLRRQMIRPYRKPLVVMSPKSLLRHPLAVSPMEEFTEGGFKNVIDETDHLKPAEQIERLLLCTGKIYYELLEKRRAEKINSIAIIRLEQLYPFPDDELCEILQKYSGVTECIWCQEEPFNQGSWLNLQPWLLEALAKCDKFMTLNVVCRPAMAAPAEGSNKAHAKAQQQIIDKALGLIETE